MADKVIGIDLGTTNCAVAYLDSDQGSDRVEIFRILQFVAPGEIEPRETLPSFHYTPVEGEFGAWRLPWQTDDPEYLVGVFASLGDAKDAARKESNKGRTAYVDTKMIR